MLASAIISAAGTALAGIAAVISTLAALGILPARQRKSSGEQSGHGPTAIKTELAPVKASDDSEKPAAQPAHTGH
jgi:hypothetical protein